MNGQREIVRRHELGTEIFLPLGDTGTIVARMHFNNDIYYDVMLNDVAKTILVNVASKTVLTSTPCPSTA